MSNQSSVPSPTDRRSRRALLRVALFDIVLPLAAVIALQRNGAPPIVAYASAGVFPALSVLVSWLQQRSIDVIGVGVLAGLASTFVVALLTNDPRFALARAAPAFALFGVACFASLPSPRPLMFFVARSFAANGNQDRIASWNQRIESSAFRQRMRLVTAVWGSGALAQAVLGFTVAFMAPASLALVIEPMMAVAITAALLAWSRSLSPVNQSQPVNQET